jgi:hypothetical protein
VIGDHRANGLVRCAALRLTQGATWAAARGVRGRRLRAVTSDAHDRELDTEAQERVVSRTEAFHEDLVGLVRTDTNEEFAAGSAITSARSV